MDSTPGIDHWGDITVVSLYFVGVLAVGLWSLCRPDRGSVRSYFLASRNMQWWPVGASLFSSNIGSEHFVGLAGTGAAAGIAMVVYEFSSMLLVILLAWIFLPVYVSSGVYTLPEYMAKRFGGTRLRVYLCCLSLVLYIFTKLAVSIFAGALFINMALGWDMYWSIAGLLAVTAIYTILGGLAAVIYTDTLQTFIMSIGAVFLAVISFNKIGGYRQLESRYMMAVPSDTGNQSDASCGRPRDDSFHIFRDPVNSDQPWPGLLLQSSIGCMWYWCCDQVIVQRSLAAKNLSHAKGGSMLAGYLKLTPLFFMVFPGMISRALYPDVIACTDPAKCEEYCENPVGCSNMAYPKLVLELMPLGLRGLLMAVMLSAIMSSLTSIFNSSATLFTMDLWRRMRRQASEKELLIVGRLFVLLLCGVSILWIPMVKSSQGGQLFNYIQAIQGYLGTPIGALFLMAILWKRMNERGAFYGILIGHGCGVIRMAIDFSFPAPACGESDERPTILSAVHYTYFGSLSLLITSIAIVIFSFTSPAPTDEELDGVTWWTKISQSRQPPGGATDASTDLANGRLSGKPSQMEEDVESYDKFAHSRDGSRRGTDDDDDDNDDDDDGEGRGRCQRWCDSVCGFPTDSGKRNKQAPEITYNQRLHFLTENPKWQGILNVNAAIGLSVMTFLIGYFR